MLASHPWVCLDDGIQFLFFPHLNWLLKPPVWLESRSSIFVEQLRLHFCLCCFRLPRVTWTNNLYICDQKTQRIAICVDVCQSPYCHRLWEGWCKYACLLICSGNFFNPWYRKETIGCMIFRFPWNSGAVRKLHRALLQRSGYAFVACGLLHCFAYYLLCMCNNLHELWICVWWWSAALLRSSGLTTAPLAAHLYVLVILLRLTKRNRPAISLCIASFPVRSMWHFQIRDECQVQDHHAVHCFVRKGR